jgi:protein-tyrosine phosphatase
LQPNSIIVRWGAGLNTNYGTLRGWVRQCLAQVAYVLGRYEGLTELPGMPGRRLVFVCLGNINRSAFAAEVARRQGLPAVSIGLSTTTGACATPLAIAQATRQGYALEAHRATDMADYRFDTQDLLVAMEARHVERLMAQGVPRQSIVLLGAWSTPQRLHLHDPHTLSAAYFSTCFTLIESAVINMAASWPGLRNEAVAVAQRAVA